tara:strand:+ start:1338 stop:2189 length:852 start_codon:yes stop_codon:yes gene_type:complete
MLVDLISNESYNRLSILIQIHVKHQNQTKRLTNMNKKNFNFCVFCWRSIANTGKRLGRTQYFCSLHKSTGATKTAHENYKRRLYATLKLKKLAVDDKLPRHNRYTKIYENVLKLTISPSYALSRMTFTSLGIAKQSVAIFSLISWAYPLTYKKTKYLIGTTFKDKEDFADTLISALTTRDDQETLPIRSASLEVGKDAEIWIPLVIEMLARHEVFELISEMELRRGGTNRGKDIELRNRIVAIVKEYKSQGIEPVQKEIAAKVGRTPQRVSVIYNELKKQNRV